MRLNDEMQVNYFWPAQDESRLRASAHREWRRRDRQHPFRLAGSACRRPVSHSASKAAAYSLTQSLRAELPGTLVIGVMPGFVDTEMVANIQAPKLAPTDVGAAIIKALREGTEDVYPGSAADIAAGLRHDPRRWRNNSRRCWRGGKHTLARR